MKAWFSRTTCGGAEEPLKWFSNQTAVASSAQYQAPGFRAIVIRLRGS